MPDRTKLATCCYCGARTLLKPTARHGHELACGSCGAPLHEMKWLKAPKAAPKHRRTPDRPLPARSRSYHRKKKRKSGFDRWKDRFEDVFDVIEDIFD